MSPRSQRAPKISSVEAAGKHLKNFDWNLPHFVITEDVEDECTRSLHVLADERYGSSLSEFEETYERSRWFRSQAMIRHLDRFKKLVELCSTFVDELTKVGRQSCLGIRAGLLTANIHERPTPQIEFKPAALPDVPPLNCAEYESLVGGPHVFGARLLWWCAASKSLETFGYSLLHFQQLWAQPFWFKQSGIGALKANPRPLNLLQQAANYCLGIEDIPATSGNGEQIHEHGPGAACSFYWKGKKIELQQKHAKMMNLLWRNQEKPVPLRKAEDEVWDGEPQTHNAYWSLASRLNKRFLDEQIPIEVHFRKCHFSMEITREE